MLLTEIPAALADVWEHKFDWETEQSSVQNPFETVHFYICSEYSFQCLLLHIALAVSQHIHKETFNKETSSCNVTHCASLQI